MVALECGVLKYIKQQLALVIVSQAVQYTMLVKNRWWSDYCQAHVAIEPDDTADSLQQKCLRMNMNYLLV